jgi:hypothetical protein
MEGHSKNSKHEENHHSKHLFTQLTQLKIQKLNFINIKYTGPELFPDTYFNITLMSVSCKAN